MATAKDVMKKIADNEVKFVDLRFTDTKGKEQHVTVPLSHFDEDTRGVVAISGEAAAGDLQRRAREEVDSGVGHAFIENTEGGAALDVDGSKERGTR